MKDINEQECVEVWKVCKVMGNGEFWSALTGRFLTKKRAIKYALGKEALPIPGTAGCFAFRSPEAARCYLSANACSGPYVILRCKARGVWLLEKALFTDLLSTNAIFTKPHYWNPDDTFPTPPGTVTCAALTPIEMVDLVD